MNDKDILRIKNVTQGRLKELYTYDPLTGILLRKKLYKKRSSSSVNNKPNAYGYIVIQIDNRKYPLHRLAFLYMNGSFPTNVVDHINGDKLDNRWSNLRDVTVSINNKNKPLRFDNKSGFNGVIYHNQTSKWQATIRVDGVTKYLGIFDEKEDAIEARKIANDKFDFYKNHGREQAKQLREGVNTIQGGDK